MDNKILTLIIPTYNMEKYLRRCLNSLCGGEKMMQLLDVIVVNDGSKDSSSDIAHEYTNAYPNVFRVIDKENRNYGSCFNRGIKDAKGKYIRLLDADDWFDTLALEVFINRLSLSESVDVIFTNYSLHYNNGKYIPQCFNGKECDITDIEECNLYNNNLKMICMHAITLNKDFVIDIGLKLDEGISYTDSEYCFFSLLRAKTFSMWNINLYQYFLGRDGQTVSMQNILRNIDAFYIIQNRLLEAYIKQIKVINKNRNFLLLKIFSDGLRHIYANELLYKKNDKLSSRFIQLDEMVESIPSLSKLIKKFTYKKIPYVWLWKKLRIKSYLLFKILMICQKK